MGCVYKATNRINGKAYIGKTLGDLMTRQRWHLASAGRGEGYAFHRALRKHGADAFEWVILHESTDDDELFALECSAIISHNTKSPSGYNLTKGGDGVRGRTPEVLAKIVAFHTGRKRSEETKRRLREACVGRKPPRLGAILSDESKKKISASLKGRKVADEVKAKIGNYMRGKPKTDQQKFKMSQAKKRWWIKRKAESSEPISA